MTFGDPGTIVWLDVSPTVWRVLEAQVAVGALEFAIVRAVTKVGLPHFEVSTRFAADHPLRNTAFRDFHLKGYICTFGMGAMLIYAILTAFLGPAFVTGACRDFEPNATHVWVARALQCMTRSASSADPA